MYKQYLTTSVAQIGTYRKSLYYYWLIVTGCHTWKLVMTLQISCSCKWHHVRRLVFQHSNCSFNRWQFLLLWFLCWHFAGNATLNAIFYTLTMWQSIQELLVFRDYIPLCTSLISYTKFWKQCLIIMWLSCLYQSITSCCCCCCFYLLQATQISTIMSVILHIDDICMCVCYIWYIFHYRLLLTNVLSSILIIRNIKDNSCNMG